MPVYGYCRVSTARQVNEGESLEAQRRMIEGTAQVLGVTVDKVFVERGVSGSRALADRPQGQALLETVERGDLIITPKLDRMFRSAINALDVLERLQADGVSLHMIDLGGDVTGNGVSKLVFTILSAVAEAERDRIRERVSEIKADQRARNRYLGGDVPFGFTLAEDGEIIPDPEGQAHIARMVELRGQKLSYRAIATEMTADGVTLSHMAVRNILKREEKEPA